MFKTHNCDDQRTDKRAGRQADKAALIEAAHLCLLLTNHVMQQSSASIKFSQQPFPFGIATFVHSLAGGW